MVESISHQTRQDEFEIRRYTANGMRGSKLPFLFKNENWKAFTLSVNLGRCFGLHQVYKAYCPNLLE